MAPADISRRTAGTLLAAIVALGAALRLCDLGGEALWGDEALTVLLARNPVVDLMFRPVDPTPGLYYVLHGLVPSGADAALQRLPAALAGIATIAAAYWLGRSSLDRRAGLWVAAFVALSEPLIVYSREARAYSVLMLLITLAAACFVKAFPRPSEGRSASVRPKFLVACGLLSLLAIYTHLIGWFWAGPALLAAIVLWRRRCGGSWIALAAFCGVALLLVIPEAIRLSGYASSSLNSFTWLEQPDAGAFLALVSSVTLPDAFRPNIVTPRWPNAGQMLAAGLVILPVMALAAALVLRRRAIVPAMIGRPSVALVVLLLALMPVLVWMVGYAATPIAMQRTFLPASLAVFLGYAWIGRTVSRWFLPLLLGAYAAATAVTYPAFGKADWAGIAGLVQLQAKPQQPVILCRSYATPAILHAYQQSKGRPTSLIMARDGGFAAVRMGGAGDAVAEFDRLVWAPHLPAFEDRRSSHPIQTIRIESAVVVRYQCPPDEWARIGTWLGPGRMQPLPLSARQMREGFQLDRFVPDRPANRPVAVAP